MIGAHQLRTSQAPGIQAIAACWLVLPLSGYTFALPKEEPFGIEKDAHEHARQVLTGHVGKGLLYRCATVKDHLEAGLKAGLSAFPHDASAGKFRLDFTRSHGRPGSL